MFCSSAVGGDDDDDDDQGIARLQLISLKASLSS
jgi:hypothetical protein